MGHRCCGRFGPSHGCRGLQIFVRRREDELSRRDIAHGFRRRAHGYLAFTLEVIDAMTPDALLNASVSMPWMRCRRAIYAKSV